MHCLGRISVSQVVALLSVIVWPALIGLALCGFRVRISDLIANVSERIKTGGVEFAGVKIAPQQIPADAAAATQQGLPSVASTGSTPNSTLGPGVAKRFAPPVRDYTAFIEKRLDDILPVLMEQFSISKEDATRYAAVDHIAALRLERASRVIFGSQIEAINLLTSRGGRVPLETLQPIYTSATVNFPQVYTNYTFEQWLSYLVTWDLITIKGSDVILEPAGKVIVSYMQGWGYLNTRPLG
jgi:hypothetical protein